MTRAGRPLRFLMAVIGGWIAIRAVQLWPTSEFDAIAPPAYAAAVQPPAARRRAVSGGSLGIERASIGPTTIRSYRNGVAPVSTGSGPLQETPIDTDFASVGRMEEGTPGQTAFIGFAPLVPVPRADALEPPLTPTGVRSRLAGSAWLIARGRGAVTPFAPQLGGSQAGARLTYAVGDSRRLALATRVSSALESAQREAAIGIDWRPTALPVHLIAEQRIGIQDARGGPSVGLIAGLPPLRVMPGVALDGYLQAGAIARSGIEGYADGALRLATPVTRAGPVRIELGLGAWGGAQRGAARLDLGPAVSAALPLGGQPVRVSLEWRQRVAGNARPGSGAALAIGTDF